ncbi:hypothetical protein R3P38DRAFT_2517064 [Favolaschia claudopus]|uniref:Uncharacterized protein n=1 Tax=Favolaschia claudopus TaxID=2862362 RepID=A0AAW0CDL8_9AGAR
MIKVCPRRDSEWLSPVCIFQSDAPVSAEYWAPRSGLRASIYLGFHNGAIEKVTLRNFEFDGNPQRKKIVPPDSEGSILHISHGNCCLAYTVIKRKQTDAFGNNVQRVVKWSPLQEAVFGPEDLADDVLTDKEDTE